jgi:very-short-patch-repair endonuclease
MTGPHPSGLPGLESALLSPIPPEVCFDAGRGFVCGELQIMENNSGIITKQKINPVKLKRAKEFRRNMTPVEKRLWDRLRNNRLEGVRFRRQQVIRGFITDYYCNPAKLVVEIDGGIHKYTREQDEEREKIIKEMGIRVIRITNEEIETDIVAVLNRILCYCREKAT